MQCSGPALCFGGPSILFRLIGVTALTVSMTQRADGGAGLWWRNCLIIHRWKCIALCKEVGFSFRQQDVLDLLQHCTHVELLTCLGGSGRVRACSCFVGMRLFFLRLQADIECFAANGEIQDSGFTRCSPLIPATVCKVQHHNSVWGYGEGVSILRAFKSTVSPTLVFFFPLFSALALQAWNINLIQATQTPNLLFTSLFKHIGVEQSTPPLMAYKAAKVGQLIKKSRCLTDDGDKLLFVWCAPQHWENWNKNPANT